MKGKFIFSAVLCLLLLAACAEAPATDTMAPQEPTSDSVTPRVFDLDTFLAGLNLSDATLTYYNDKIDTYPAGSAIRAERYIEELRSYTWEEYLVPAEWDKNTDDSYQLTTPSGTLTAFQSDCNNSCPLHVVTDSGEGWFTLPYIEGEQEGRMFYDAFALWYNEA